MARVLVGALLAEEFGAELGSDARFQAMVDEVVATMLRDPSTSTVLKGAIRQLQG